VSGKTADSKAEAARFEAPDASRRGGDLKQLGGEFFAGLRILKQRIVSAAMNSGVASCWMNSRMTWGAGLAGSLGSVGD